LIVQKLQIRIDAIKDSPYELAVMQPVEHLPILFEMQNNGECTFLADVNGQVTIRREFDHYVATGTVSVPFTLPCSRCLQPVTGTVSPSFKVIYRKDTGEEGVIEDETELTEDDLVSTLYSGDELDIGHEIEMQIAMAIPVKPLCSEVCKGLCPGCGANLSVEPCYCTGSNASSPFSVLKNFKATR
jgi:uncharacterized protein